MVWTGRLCWVYHPCNNKCLYTNGDLMVYICVPNIRQAKANILICGTTRHSSSKIHAPLEVAKGYHVGYFKAEINLNGLHHCQCELCFWHVMDRTKMMGVDISKFLAESV